MFGFMILPEERLIEGTMIPTEIPASGINISIIFPKILYVTQT